MKKIIFTFSLLFTFQFATQLNAQECAGGSGSSICIPQGGPLAGGFPESSTIPCAVKDSLYNYSIEFTMFSIFNFLGMQTVDSMEINTIDNLPCGLCWAVNKVNRRYVANEDGCINIKGTAKDQPGQYKLAISVNAWINNGPNAIPVSASLFDQTGIRIMVRVKTSTDPCVAVDTAVNAVGNITAALSCPVLGVSNLTGNHYSVNISPNPMNSGGSLSFYSVKAIPYIIRIVDVTGKVVSSKEIEATVGVNLSSLESDGLAPGIYFLSLTGGRDTTTKRFTVTE